MQSAASRMPAAAGTSPKVGGGQAPSAGRGRGRGRNPAALKASSGAPEPRAKPLTAGKSAARAPVVRSSPVSGPAPASLDGLIGFPVRIHLKSGRTTEGIFFGADASGTLVLQQAAAQLHGTITGMRHVSMINAASVIKIDMTGGQVEPQEQAPLGTKLPALN